MIITPDMVKRRLIFDCMSDPAEVCLMAGLTGVSPEGAEAEEEMSRTRMEEVLPLHILVDDMSAWLAEIATKLQVRNIPEEPPPGFLEEMEAMFASVIHGSLMASLSVLNDLGIIKVVPPEEFEAAS